MRFIMDLKNWTLGFALVMIVFDLLSGFVKGWVTKTWSSTIARKGLVTHALVIFILVAIHPFVHFATFQDIGISMGGAFVADVVSLMFGMAYAGSVAENLYAMGVPIPIGTVHHFTKMMYSDSKDEGKDE